MAWPPKGLCFSLSIQYDLIGMSSRFTRLCNVALSSFVQMLLDVQRMQDDVLELRVKVAVNANKLVRLDNPIVNNKLRCLKRKAEEALGREE